LAIRSGNAGAIAYQAADGGELAPLVDRGNRMARRQRDKFIPLVVEKGIAADNDRSRPLSDKYGEGGVASRFLPST
jgi:hypothetical protein